MCVESDKRDTKKKSQSKVVQNSKHFRWSNLLKNAEQRIQKIDVKCGDKRHKRHISSIQSLTSTIIKEIFQKLFKQISCLHFLKSRLNALLQTREKYEKMNL